MQLQSSSNPCSSFPPIACLCEQPIAAGVEGSDWSRLYLRQVARVVAEGARLCEEGRKYGKYFFKSGEYGSC
jgi:hypothetical protein